MSRSYTSANLIESVKRRCAVPINTSTWTPTRILAAADEVITERIVPMVRRYGGRHFETFYDQTTTADDTSYDVPTEAMHRSLVNVAALDSDSRPVSVTIVDLHREIDLGSWWRGYVQEFPETRGGVYMQGDQLHIYPEGFAGTLRLYYERLPNRLCRSQTDTVQGVSFAAEAVQVVSVDTGTGAITCTTSSVPSTITTSTPVCVVQGTPGFRLKLALSSNPTAVTTSVVTLGSDIAAVAAAGIVAGDWVQLAGDSAVLQLPVEAHSIVAQAVAVQILRAMGAQSLGAAVQELREITETYEKSFPLRIAEGPKLVHSYNRLLDHMR